MIQAPSQVDGVVVSTVREDSEQSTNLAAKPGDKVHRPPTAAQLIRKSTYSDRLIIDESVTTTLPTFARKA
jgi:hypothetical protein